MKLQAYVSLQILFNPWILSKIRQTCMKMSKYENSLFPYSFLSTVNLPEWRHKCYFTIFSPSIYWDNYCRKKRLFSKLHDKYCLNWRNLGGIVTKSEFFFSWLLVKINLFNLVLIKTKDFHDKEQKIYTNFFYFYILKEFSRKMFS